MAKLLMITGLGSAKDLASGRPRAFYNTLEEFHKYWERIDIVCPRVNDEFSIFNFQFSKLKTLVLFGNVYIHISPWPLIFHPLFFVYKILKLHRKIKFDLMTVHEFPPFYNGIGAWIISVVTKIPYILEIHHIPGYPKAANFKEVIYRNLMRWFIKFDVSKSAVVRVVNQNETPEFLKKAGVPENKIIYIPSMYIDLNVFKSIDLPKKYDVIFVGRLEPNKGINLLFQAIKILSRTIPEFKAKIIGDGSLRKFVNDKIRLLPEGSVKFEDGFVKQENMVKFLNESKILVMSSYNEGGPRVVVEAMACGVPVLATNVGLMPDFADKNAIKIINWDAEDIVQKVKNLLENDNERVRMAVAGLEIAKQFEKKAAIKNYADKLKAVLG